jgi:hypothetical protein
MLFLPPFLLIYPLLLGPHILRIFRRCHVFGVWVTYKTGFWLDELDLLTPYTHPLFQSVLPSLHLPLCIFLPCIWVWVLCYDRRSVGQSFLEWSTLLGLTTRFLLLSDSCRFVDVGRSLSDERTGLSFIIAAGSGQRSHSRVLVPWDSPPYFTVSDSRLPFPSPPTTRRDTVEVFDPAPTRHPPLYLLLIHAV